MSVPPLTARLLAEFVGTAALCAMGIGAILGLGSAADSAATLVAVALVHGLAIAVMVTAVGHVSGGHFNPAVSFAALVTRNQTPRDFVAYVLAQLAGAVAGSFLVKGAYGDRWSDQLANVALAKDVGIGQGILLEAIATFFLVWVVFGVAIDPKGAWAGVSGLPIGLVIVADILMIGPLTGGTMNPARWFGPNVLAGEFADLTAWIIGPLLGGAVAGLLYTYVIRAREVRAA